MKCNEPSERGNLLVQTGLLLVLLFGVSPAMAQIVYESPATHRQDLRYGLHEAGEVESVYKETHLNLDNRNFRKGASGHKRVKLKDHPYYYKNNRRSGGTSFISRINLFKSKKKGKP